MELIQTFAFYHTIVAKRYSFRGRHDQKLNRKIESEIVRVFCVRSNAASTLHMKTKGEVQGHRKSVFAKPAPRFAKDPATGLIIVHPCYMYKRSSGALGSWQKRWFTLSAAYLVYRASEAHEGHDQAQATSIDLRRIAGVEISANDPKELQLTYTPDEDGTVEEMFRFRDKSVSSAQRWLVALKQRSSPEKMAQAKADAQDAAQSSATAPRARVASAWEEDEQITFALDASQPLGFGITDIADGKHGLKSIHEGSQAERLGLRVGDTIVSIGGDALDEAQSTDAVTAHLRNAIDKARASGQPLPIIIVRGNHPSPAATQKPTRPAHSPWSSGRGRGGGTARPTRGGRRTSMTGSSRPSISSGRGRGRSRGIGGRGAAPLPARRKSLSSNFAQGQQQNKQRSAASPFRPSIVAFKMIAPRKAGFVGPPPTLCDACTKPLEGEYLCALGGQFHRACFKCTTCSAAIDGIEIKCAEGDDGEPYCVPCRIKKIGGRGHAWRSSVAESAYSNARLKEKRERAKSGAAAQKTTTTGSESRSSTPQPRYVIMPRNPQATPSSSPSSPFAALAGTGVGETNTNRPVNTVSASSSSSGTDWVLGQKPPDPPAIRGSMVAAMARKKQGKRTQPSAMQQQPQSGNPFAGNLNVTEEAEEEEEEEEDMATDDDSSGSLVEKAKSPNSAFQRQRMLQQQMQQAEPNRALSVPQEVARLNAQSAAQSQQLSQRQLSQAATGAAPVQAAMVAQGGARTIAQLQSEPMNAPAQAAAAAASAGSWSLEATAHTMDATSQTPTSVGGRSGGRSDRSGETNGAELVMALLQSGLNSDAKARAQWRAQIDEAEAFARAARWRIASAHESPSSTAQSPRRTAAGEPHITPSSFEGEWLNTQSGSSSPPLLYQSRFAQPAAAEAKQQQRYTYRSPTSGNSPSKYAYDAMSPSMLERRSPVEPRARNLASVQRALEIARGYNSNSPPQRSAAAAAAGARPWGVDSSEQGGADRIKAWNAGEGGQVSVQPRRLEDEQEWTAASPPQRVHVTRQGSIFINHSSDEVSAARDQSETQQQHAANLPARHQREDVRDVLDRATAAVSGRPHVRVNRNGSVFVASPVKTRVLPVAEEPVDESVRRAFGGVFAAKAGEGETEVGTLSWQRLMYLDREVAFRRSAAGGENVVEETDDGCPHLRRRPLSSDADPLARFWADNAKLEAFRARELAFGEAYLETS